MLVKICGLKDSTNAQIAIENGTNLVGMIMVPNRDRTISSDEAIKIVEYTSKQRKLNNSKEISELYHNNELNHENNIEFLTKNGPFSVGVFRNQPIEDIIDKYNEIKFDIVQLHGNESRIDYLNTLHELKIPTIIRFKPNEELIFYKGMLLPLFDSEIGGEGKTFNWDQLNGKGFLLAGGLTPDNLHDAGKVNGVIGFDVSSGVETEGSKDNDKIISFINNGKLQ